MKSAVVYCASSPGTHPKYMNLAKEVGQKLATEGIHMIYGGGGRGLMGQAANAALDNGGNVTGIIPEFLANWEQAHPELTSLEIVETMHQRKARMVALSDGIIVLPGGYGTLDELFEILAWAQLKIFHGPVALLNYEGFYDFLLVHLKKTVEEGFLKQENLDLLLVVDSVDDLLVKMRGYDVSV